MKQSTVTIAVIENDVSVCQAIARLLRATGFGAETFFSAETFLNSGGSERAACLILDIHLGGMSGFDLQQHLATAGSRLPVILVTADESLTTRARAEKSGCSAFLQKPLDAQNLIPALQRAMNLGESSAE